MKSHGKQPYLSAETEKLFLQYLNNNIKETALCRTYPELYELNTVFNAFVCGSDQIWSPLCYDDKYFLSFVKQSCKMIAYAPSIGSTDIKEPTIRKNISNHISRFSYLSVREQQGAKLIQTLTGKEAKIVLDPTLLMTAAELDNYTNTAKTSESPGSYIICYFLGDAERYMKYIRNLSAQMKLPFYIIPITTKQKKASESVPFPVGPNEFVKLIKNSAYVCTDSFHGMAFSINYNVPFSVFKRFSDHDPENQNSRVLSLLNLLHLESRLVSPKDKIDINKVSKCNFSHANRYLSEQRELSMQYLTDSLAQAVNAAPDTKDSPYKITDMCCGCGACATECPVNAIEVAQNEEGFLHYSIDSNRCILCGKCKAVCPMSTVIAPEMKDSIALYALKSTSDKVLKTSSSGGAGYELARLCLAQNYYVSGCMYDSSDNLAKHIVISPNETNKLKLLQGSKYIQSLSENALGQICELARSNPIAFFGTPCQVAAIDKLLQKQGTRDHALLVDLICHGVPSYFLWNKYLHDLNEEYHIGTHPKVSFRSEDGEWRHRVLSVRGNNHQYKRPEHKDDFYAFFKRSLCYMEVCYDCPYREKSAADLRIGDYWGIRFEKDNMGVSMIIANTPAGNNFINILDSRNLCNVQKYNLSEYWTIQYPYNPPMPLFHKQLIEELKGTKSLHHLRTMYCHYYDVLDNISKIYQKIKHIIKRG